MISWCNATTVTIYLEEDDGNLSFIVHKDLCNVSPVFKAAFAGNFQESKQQSLKLRETNTATVNRLLDWIYTRDFQLPDPISVTKAQSFYFGLARLYALADEHGIVHLKNCVIDKFQSYSRKGESCIPNHALVLYVYENTAPSSTLRILLVAWYAHDVVSEWYGRKSTVDFLYKCPDFAVGLAVELGRHRECPGTECALYMDVYLLHESA